MAMGRKAQVKIDEIDIPKDYFDLKREDKEELCEYIANKIYLMVDRSTHVGMNRDAVVDLIIQSSLITNEEEENYEMCQVLVDIRKLINEKKD
jgi:hypothetical protein